MRQLNRHVVRLFGCVLMILAAPALVSAESILIGEIPESIPQSEFPSESYSGAADADSQTSEESGEPAEAWDDVLDHLMTLSTSAGGGMSSSSSTASGGSSSVGAAIVDSDPIQLCQESHERLTAIALLILLGPDPLEMLDPPKRTA